MTVKIHRRRPHRPPSPRTSVVPHPKAVPVLDVEQDGKPLEQPFVEGAQDMLDPNLRHRLISETAYRHLTERGYADGYEADDWLEAEAEVDHVVVTPQAGR
jgi:Protein of unknown function (DUF2934)